MRPCTLSAAVLIAAIIFLLAPKISFAENQDKALMSRIRTITQNRQKTLALIASERADLTRQQKEVQKEIDDIKKRNALLHTELETLLQKEADRRAQLQEQEHEREAIKGAIRSTAHDARELFRAMPSTPEFPDRTAVINRILAPERFPHLEDTSALLDILGEAAAHSKEVVYHRGRFIARNGLLQNGTMVRVGEFSVLYEDAQGEVGFLQPDRTGTRLKAVAGSPGWWTRRNIQKFMTGEEEIAPVDISGGAVLEQMEQQSSPWETIRSGGVLVWPILITGVVGILIGLERTFQLRRRSGSSKELLPCLLSLLEQNNYAEATALCETSSSTPQGRVLVHLITHAGAEKEILESCLEESLLREAAPLERFLPTLSVLAATAPLLGLLGTVTGMIATFQTITMLGTGDPRMMSGGISEALITTQLGLIVAIPLVLLHHFLDRKVDGIIGEMEEQGTTLTLALLKHGPGPANR